MRTWAETFDRGVRSVGLTVLSEHRRLLQNYLELLSKWRKKINLVGRSVGDELMWLHVIDSLFAATHVPDGAQRLVDVGSGAGFPAIPIAIMRPELEVTALEPNRKKHAFLSTARRELPLANLFPTAERLASHTAATMAHGYDVAISRATFAVDEWFESARPLVKPGGVILAMEGANAGSMPAGTTRHPYQLQPKSGVRTRAMLRLQT